MEKESSSSSNDQIDDSKMNDNNNNKQQHKMGSQKLGNNYRRRKNNKSKNKNEKQVDNHVEENNVSQKQQATKKNAKKMNTKEKQKKNNGVNNNNNTKIDVGVAVAEENNFSHSDEDKNKVMETNNNNNNNKRNNRRRQKKKNNNNSKKDSENNINNTNVQKENNNDNSTNNNNNNKNNTFYIPHLPIDECIERYHNEPDTFIRGKLRVLPGNSNKTAFVTCDRGTYIHDIIIEDTYHRNRALDGDTVYVSIINNNEEEKNTRTIDELTNDLKNAAMLKESNGIKTKDDDIEQDEKIEEEEEEVIRTWQDDEVQMDLWNPQVSIVRRDLVPSKKSASDDNNNIEPPIQRKGLVVHVVHPKSIVSELHPGSEPGPPPLRRIVGSITILNRSGTILLTPTNKALPQFKCPNHSTQKLIENLQKDNPTAVLEATLFQAEYEYGSWKQSHKQWPPCQKVQILGESCVMENEIDALLTSYQVDHGDFTSTVLKDVDDAVSSGIFYEDGELNWKPTVHMYKGRRDYRNQRIFTIDPTTAKDLDDALHITELSDGTIEIGVHIADVSYFVQPNTSVDNEAIRRATTVYLVDRTIPMLPRPLCEIACSLNENVERLAFSCVWKMNPDGTLRTNKNGKQDVWYGRSVIKSCARLDYATAQNIIDNKVCCIPDEKDEDIDEELWPKSRRPIKDGIHTIHQVATDVRLMHRVAMARRKLRFEHGALALNSVKLTFELDTDGQTPLLAAPYPIRDSNRLIEEYMLLANYLVAERLITHAGDRACLRHHPPPNMESIDKVVTIAKVAMNFRIDTSSSQDLQRSLVRLSQTCTDELILQCVTQLLTLPMQKASYFAAGCFESDLWKHFALNMPYYTHFTSPIRRYPDVIVHRLLQATLDGKDAVDTYPHDYKEINHICIHCSEKQIQSKEAQQRCDRVFLSLYLRKYPLKSEMGIVLSVGKTAFTVFVPRLGADGMLYLEEHKDILGWADDENKDGTRRILLQQKLDAPGTTATTRRWNTLEIKVFTKLTVTVLCKEKTPIDIKMRLEGPWNG